MTEQHTSMTEQHTGSAHGSGRAGLDQTAAAGPPGLDADPPAHEEADQAVPASGVGSEAALVGTEMAETVASEAEPAPARERERERERTLADGEEVAGDPGAWPPDELLEAVELDERGWVRRDLEAILLVADEPVSAVTLAEVVGERLSRVEELLIELAAEYARDARGFVLRAVAGGWRLYTHPGARDTVDAYVQAGQQSRLTRAALETLAVIAYRQPVTRFQVAAVRGVSVDGVFRTLLARGLIREVGRDDGPGQAMLYGTTAAFLEQLGLNTLDELPPIKDYLPEGVDLTDLQDQL
ncbi:MAG TPA: SMC-Scp complex subunit ScpB [Actinomycetes bacterium]|jgi:segregation and condensation protein B|nr:SMC-Scp complex subunit ScpB [Actinomycetes bacterium]